MMDKEQLALEVVKIFAGSDEQEELYFNEELKPWVMCSDTFFWGTADGEYVEADDLDLLRSSLQDSDCHGVTLFVARKRGMRPQGAVYTYIPKENWHLFDAAGPEREKGFGNPYAPGEYKFPAKGE